MADKSFGLKQVNLIGASGTPRIESPNNLNINATNVAISTDMSVGGELTVTDTFLKPQAVGLGTTDATGRDAGISTSVGTLIYDSSVGLQIYTGDTAGWRTVSGTATLLATGGTVSNFGGKTLHTFTSTGPFSSPQSLDCEVLCVGGGGGSGSAGGGGGAGGYRSVPVTIPAVAHTVTVGGGGADNTPSQPDSGTASSITVTGPGVVVVFASGGGAGGAYAPSNSGQPGGSGGGRAWNNPTAGSTVASPDGISPTTQGFNGGPSVGPGGGGPSNPHSASGGGGAGAIGTNGGGPGPNTSLAGGNGGAGLQAPSTFRDPNGNQGAPGPGGGNYWFAGGGGGGTWYNHGSGGRGGNPSASSTSDNPFAGGGNAANATGSAPRTGDDGAVNTGGGGGGGWNGPPAGTSAGGQGGSGIVIIAYPS